MVFHCQKEIGNYAFNVSYIKMDDIVYDKEVTTELMNHDHVLAISNTQYMKKTVSNMLVSLDNVVLILFVFSALLSFVVLYNLS